MNLDRTLTAARTVLAAAVRESIVGRIVSRVVRPIATDERGLFGIPDQVFGIIIGISLLVGAIFSVSVARAWAATGACSTAMEKIDTGVGLLVASNTGNGVLTGGPGTTVPITDAQLTPYLTGDYTDPAAPQNAVYTVTDTSSGTNGDTTWLIKCPGNHMGLTTLRWYKTCAVTKHQLGWDSAKGMVCP